MLKIIYYINLNEDSDSESKEIQKGVLEELEGKPLVQMRLGVDKS